MVVLAEAEQDARGVVAELAESAARDDEPKAAQVDAAVLIADVSGFTALTASLQASHGGRGADMLSTIMDRLLGTMAEIAEGFGGLVADIIGDAIHVLWVVEGTRDIDDARTKAAAAASAMLDYAIAASDGQYGTPVRLGVASGTVDLAMVGGHEGRWELLAMGPALIRAGEACARSPKNACLIGGGQGWRETAEQAGAHPENEEWWLLERSPTAIPGPVKAQARSDAMIWNAELRLITTMFCSLVRADESAHVSVERVHQLTRVAQRIVAEHGGMVDKIHADEKGVSMVIAFGMHAAPLAVGDTGHNISGGSALHGVLAAIDLRRALIECGADPSVGIATGKVRVGIDDAARGSSHTMYGNAVNFAARCMQAGRSEILCDETTRSAASSEIGFTLAEARVLKGLDAAEIFAVAGVRAETLVAPADTTPIAGREAECGAIGGFLTATDPAASRVLILEGNHGSGKSRLAAFALDEAGRQGQQTMLLRAGLLGTRTPLFAWREPMAMLLRARARAAGVSLDAAQAELVAAAGGTAEDAPQIAMLFGREGQASADDEAEGAAALSRQLRTAAAIALIGDAPRLVVVEDAHWLDDVSIQLARDLLRIVPQVRMILVAQSPVPSSVTKVARDATRIVLGDLDRDATGALAAQLLGDFDPKHPFVDWLHHRSAGNPMFARALIAILPDDIRTTALGAPGAWRKALAALEAADMPATIEGALLARFGNLPPRQLGLLKAASVTGSSFGPEVLIALGTPSSAGEIAADLRALAAAGIIAPVESETRSEWRFADALTREVIATSLPRQLLLELHRRAAEHLETNPDPALSGGAAQIAHHWLEADRPERAIGPLRRAGLEAKQAGAYASAVALWRSALDLVESGRAGARGQGRYRRAVLHRDLAFASWRLGEPEATIRHCYSSLEGLWPGAPESDHGWRAMLARESAGLMLRIVTPEAIWKRQRGSVDARMADWLRLNNAVRLIEAFYFSKGALPAAAIALYAARIAERTGQQAYAARPYGFLGYLAGARGMNRLARFFFNRPRRDCIAKRDWSSLAQSVHGETMHLLTLGEWRDAVARARFGRRLTQKLSKTADTGSLTTLLGLGRLMGGDFAKTRDDFGKVEAIAYAKANDHYLLFAREGLGQIELAEGAPEQAEALLVAATALAASVRDLQSALISESLLANARLRLGRLDAVIASADALLARGESTPMVNFGTWYGFGALAETMLGLYAARGAGAGGAYRTWAARAVALLERFAARYPVAAPRAALCSGTLAALTGRDRDALKQWRHGIRRAAALAMNHDLARLHDALARHADVEASERALHAEEAARLMAACGVSSLPPLALKIEPQEPS